MNKIHKLKHSLYEMRMKLIQLEFTEKSRGLNKKQVAEMEVLKKKVAELEEKVARLG